MSENKPQRKRDSITFGIIIIVIGLLFLLNNLGIFHWLNWSTLWPLILIAIGVLIIVGTKRK